MRKHVCLLIASFVMAFAAFNAPGQGHGAGFAAQGRAPALDPELTNYLAGADSPQ